MRAEFTNIRHALEEHLTSINENTSEIQALFDYLTEMEVKVDKLSQRLDQLQLNQPTSKPYVIPLNQLEKRIFLVLYTETTPLSYEEISAKSGIPTPLVPECLSVLMNKGVPFLRTFINDQIFLKLEPSFKEMQAKENLVNLSLQSFME
ncbi:MAG: hypothetical protein QT02_C0003G0006 [archaeon GW2011_AR9]|nr:MAG: hypothetical protein QT02_C0003G0006 [archaeon GW2011_AR9]MBS3120928.1 hypothetical protein [Candidatus Woesearchaeota archaeon]HIH12450.1 hypothetical protein [Candidatus Woesearchaeota archaeon]